MSTLLEALKTRWADIYSRLAAGEDCPPGLLLRTEGLMEAALLQGEGSETEIQLAMAASYQRCFGRDLADDFGEDWADFHPFPQIPARMARAPVFPSTRD